MSHVEEYHIQQYQKILADFTDEILKKIDGKSDKHLRELSMEYAVKCFDLANADFYPVTLDDLDGYKPEEI